MKVIFDGKNPPLIEKEEYDHLYYRDYKMRVFGQDYSVCKVSEETGIAVSGHFGTSQVSDAGYAFSQSEGFSSSGWKGVSISCSNGESISGEEGHSIVERGGSACSGKLGIIQISYWDPSSKRKRIKVGYIGEDGLKPETWYKLDENNDFVEISSSHKSSSKQTKPFMTVQELIAFQKEAIKQETLKGERLFMGLPDRWYEKFTVRCQNGHISHTILKSEVSGDLCLECGTSCVMTFPEDKEE